MKLLLKTITLVFQIIGCLGVFWKSACRCLLMKLHKLSFPDFLKFLFARKDIHGKFFKICQVLLIHLIQYCRILHQTHLVLLQSFCDLRHISLGFCVTVFQGFHLRRLFFEETKKSLLLCGIEIFQFAYHT